MDTSLSAVRVMVTAENATMQRSDGSELLTQKNSENGSVSGTTKIQLSVEQQKLYASFKSATKDVIVAQPNRLTQRTKVRIAKG